MAMLGGKRLGVAAIKVREDRAIDNPNLFVGIRIIQLGLFQFFPDLLIEIRGLGADVT